MKKIGLINYWFISIVLSLFVLATFQKTGNAQLISSDEFTVTKAVAPVFSLGALLISENGEINIIAIVNQKGEVIKASLDDKHSWILGDKDETVSNLIKTAKKWQFSSTNNTGERKVILTFLFRVMPKGTVESDLTPIFTRPFSVEVRTDAEVKIDKVIDTKTKKN